jgi:hypothetical protein
MDIKQIFIRLGMKFATFINKTQRSTYSCLKNEYEEKF